MTRNEESPARILRDFLDEVENCETTREAAKAGAMLGYAIGVIITLKVMDIIERVVGRPLFDFGVHDHQKIEDAKARSDDIDDWSEVVSSER